MPVARRIKRVDRETRTLYAVTDEVIRQHLTGKKTIGNYPLLLGETCWFLAADFDKSTWQEDPLAFLAAFEYIWQGYSTGPKFRKVSRPVPVIWEMTYAEAQRKKPKSDRLHW